MPLVLDGSGGGGGDDLLDGRIVMDLQGGDVAFAVESGGGRLGSCRFDGDLTVQASEHEEGAFVGVITGCSHFP